jgi:hypothetical protein
MTLRDDRIFHPAIRLDCLRTFNRKQSHQVTAEVAGTPAGPQGLPVH